LAQKISSNEIIAMPVEPDSTLAQLILTVKREEACSSKMLAIKSTFKAHHHNNRVQSHFIQI
jgi:D-arabinose 5-phosphate isomerase GutQ